MKRWLKRQWREFWYSYPADWLRNPAMYDSHKEEWSFRGMALTLLIIIGVATSLGWLINDVIW